MGTYRRSTTSGKLNAKKKKRERRTKESGQAIGSPERPETIRSIRKRSKPRSDTVLAMQRIYDGGWEYDEEIALRKNANKGYYVHTVMNVDIDPDDAQDLLLYHNYEDCQRDFTDKWAWALAKDINTVHNLVFAIGPAGKALIVNGQHNLGAIMHRGLTTQAVVTIQMCRNEQCMSDLYNTFDDNIRRSFQNAIHAAKGAKALTYEGKDSNLARWCQSVAIAENNFTRRIKEGRTDQIARAKREDVQTFAAWMDGHVTDPLKRKLAPQGVGAAFFAMWQSDLENAKKYAQFYFTGENMEGKHPALVMRNKMSHRPKGEHAASVCRYHAEMMYTAWRKFCLNEPLHSVRSTRALPTPDKWRIYKSATKAIQLTLGNASEKICVANE
ncbi:MAG: hypothetical protein ACXAC5_03620 [Promethearchaeota archaeon]|jgi:hypothetical protein